MHAGRTHSRPVRRSALGRVAQVSATARAVPVAAAVRGALDLDLERLLERAGAGGKGPMPADATHATLGRRVRRAGLDRAIKRRNRNLETAPFAFDRPGARCAPSLSSGWQGLAPQRSDGGAGGAQAAQHPVQHPRERPAPLASCPPRRRRRRRLLTLAVAVGVDPPPPSPLASPPPPASPQARGVPLFDRTRFFDLPRHVARMLLDLRDISSSLFWFLTVQTWLTLWSFLITLISGAAAAAGGRPCGVGLLPVLRVSCCASSAPCGSMRVSHWELSCCPVTSRCQNLCMLCAVIFFSFYTENGKELAAPLDWVLICFVVRT